MSLASQLNHLLSVHESDALSADVLIPDDDEELTWHSFLGHHDFWRFRGDLFFLHGRGEFVALRERTPSLGVDFLATAWRQIEASNPEELRGRALLARYEWRRTSDHKENLRSDLAAGGNESQQYLALWDGFRSGLPLWYAWILFNASALAQSFSSSFRTYLALTCEHLTRGRTDLGSFPKLNWRATLPDERGSEVSLEDALARRITRDFAVGVEVARYLFCDWLLALWHDGDSMLFDSYKHDANAENFGKAHGWYRNRRQFLDLCHELRPDLPPRVINECIWLHQNQGCCCLGGPEAQSESRPRPRTTARRSVVNAGGADAEVFIDADDEYRDWLIQHPGGFVLNCDRNPRPSYLVLHSARCRFARAEGRLTTSYIKVCAADAEEIEAWAIEKTGATPQPCGHCRP